MSEPFYIVKNDGEIQKVTPNVLNPAIVNVLFVVAEEVSREECATCLGLLERAKINLLQKVGAPETEEDEPFL